MTKKERALALAFAIGAVTGGVFVRMEAPAPAVAQTAAPTPMMPGMPMPMGSSMPMMQMMPQMKSDADRGYMGAMMQMHGSMMRMTLTGNADRDLMVMMIPHHAAVAMAQTELQYGGAAKVKALAQRIISAQRAEIDEMNSWLK